MTVTLSLVARQAAAGAPIEISGREGLSAIADADNYLALGVTTTSTPPATYAAFAHVDGLPGGDFSDSYWDAGALAQSVGAEAGVGTRFSKQYTLNRLQRIDSNYVVGRYVWLATFASSTPGSSDAPQALSAPYHIV